MESVGDLLKASLAAHLRAKNFTGWKQGQQHPGPDQQRNPAKAMPEWQEALRLRLEALAADPGRTDPAWKEQPDHETLMAFYRDKGVTNG